MQVKQENRPAMGMQLFGDVPTPETLPPANTTRWTAGRKADVVAAVAWGLLTVDEVLERYGLSIEEFICWCSAMARKGTPGLQASHSQHHRDMVKRELVHH